MLIYTIISISSCSYGNMCYDLCHACVIQHLLCD
jgi:hypothetical protein